MASFSFLFGIHFNIYEQTFETINFASHMKNNETKHNITQ